jgi:hypothetical protein
VSETGRCPYCGSPAGNQPGSAAGPRPTDPEPTDPELANTAQQGLEPLYREVRRIREIAESRTAYDGAARITELTRQVQELRARWRGSAARARPLTGARSSERQRCLGKLEDVGDDLGQVLIRAGDRVGTAGPGPDRPAHVCPQCPLRARPRAAASATFRHDRESGGAGRGHWKARFGLV